MTLANDAVCKEVAVIILGKVAEQTAMNQIPAEGGGQVLQQTVLVLPAKVEIGFIVESNIFHAKQLVTGGQGGVGSGTHNGVGVAQLVIQIYTGRDNAIPSHQGVGSHDAAAGVIGGITGVDIAGQRADSRHGSGNRSRSNNLDGSARKSSAGKGCHSCRNTDDVLGLHDYYLVRVLIVDLLTRKEKYLFPLVKESETFPSQM